MRRASLTIIALSLSMAGGISCCRVSGRAECRVYACPEDVREGEYLFSAGKDSISKVFVIHEKACLFFERNKDEYVLNVKDIHTGEQVRSFVKYGKEPGEMLLVDVSVGRDRILLSDIIRNQLTEIEIGDKDFRVKTSLRPENTQEIIPYRNGRFLCLNPYSFENRAPRFFVTDRAGRYKERRRYSYDSFNVVDGSLVFSQETERVAFLSLYDSQMEIHKEQGRSLLIQIKIQRDEIVQIQPVRNGKMTEYYFVNHVPLCFVAGDGDDKGFVAAYLDERGRSSVFVLDWSGVLKDSFQTDGRIRSISLSESDAEVYCWVSLQGEDALIKYPLHQR